MGRNRNRRRPPKNTTKNNDTESTQLQQIESVGTNKRTLPTTNPEETQTPARSEGSKGDHGASGNIPKILNPQGSESAKAKTDDGRKLLPEYSYDQSTLPGCDPPGSNFRVESAETLATIIPILDKFERTRRNYGSTPDRSGLIIVDEHLHRMMTLIPLLYKALNCAHPLLLTQEYYQARFESSIWIFKPEIPGTARGVQFNRFFGNYTYPGEGRTQSFLRYRPFGIAFSVFYQFTVYLRAHSDEANTNEFVKLFLGQCSRLSYWFRRAADESYRGFFDRRSMSRMFDFCRRYGYHQPGINNQRLIGNQTHLGPITLHSPASLSFVVASGAAFLLARMGISVLVNGRMYGGGCRYVLVHETTRAVVDLMYIQTNPANNLPARSICMMNKITGQIHRNPQLTRRTGLYHPWTKVTRNFVHQCDIDDLLHLCCDSNEGVLSIHALIFTQYPDEDNHAQAQNWDRCARHNRTGRTNALLAVQEVYGAGPLDIHYVYHFDGLDDYFYCDQNGYFQNDGADYLMTMESKVVYDRILGQFALNSVKCLIPFIKEHVIRGYKDIGAELEAIPTGTKGCDSQCIQIVPTAYAVVANPENPMGYDAEKNSFDLFIENSCSITLPSRFTAAFGLVLFPHLNLRRVYSTVIRTARPLEDMREFVALNPASKDPSKEIVIRRDAI